MIHILSALLDCFTAPQLTASRYCTLASAETGLNAADQAFFGGTRSGELEAAHAHLDVDEIIWAPKSRALHQHSVIQRCQVPSAIGRLHVTTTELCQVSKR